MILPLKISPIGENESIFLDIVRFISAQLVFFGHLLSFLHGNEVMIGGRIPIQNLGVVVFFILSGYLICRTLPKYADFKEFFIDRFARIYVTLVPCLALIALMDYAAMMYGQYSYGSAFNICTWIGNLFMLQDYPILQRGLGLSDPLITSFGSARPLWTLAVEWWLYMFFGYICLTKRPTIIAIAILAIVPVIFATVGRGQGLTFFWLFGAAIIYVTRLDIKMRWLLCIVATCLALYGARVVISKDFYDLQANIFLSALFCALLMWSRRSTFFCLFPAMLKSLFQILAGASFALYILHYTIIELLLSIDTAKSSVGALSFAAANGLAVLIYLAFDRNHKKVGMFIRKVLSRPALNGNGDAA